MDTEINEYEAALRFNLSPTLLRWLTSYSVIDNVKLRYSEKCEIYYYDIKDLETLNKKMEGKWPKNENGQRPNIPSGIKNEIKREARFTCPVCNKSHGEVAHIDPVYKTQCNHPKNLIFLCPDHHTEYDDTYISSNVSKEEVLCFKQSLVIFNRTLWKIQGGIIKSYLEALNICRSLLEIHDEVKKSIPDKEFEDVLEKVFCQFKDQDFVDTLNKADGNKIKIIQDKKDCYIEQNKEKLCPLCHGDGQTDYYDMCPVCLGAGEILEFDRDKIDLSMYKLVDCKLCKGTGTYEDDDCPACNGNGKVDQYFYDNHDWSMYDLVKCKLCKGTGTYEDDDCPACNGNGKVDQYFYDNHDWSMYDLVKCKLCKGIGTYEDDDCPACNGNGKVDQYFYDNHDWSMYDLVKCKLCKGTGTYEGDDCPACNGDGKVDQYFYDNHDWSMYDKPEKH